MIKRIKRIISKYGFMRILVSSLRLCLFRIQIIIIKIIISCIRIENFIPKTTKKDILYYGDLSKDFKRIIRGDRKILSYQENDENAKKDIKMSWEKERNHILYVLAFASTKEHKKEFEEYFNKACQILDFKNTNAMEVAISTINLILAYQNYIHNHHQDKTQEISRALKKRIIYILSNLENGVIYSGNHYFFNLIGICWSLNSFKLNIFRYITFYFEKRLNKFLDIAIQEDGSLYENSTYYHKYVTESLLEYLYYNENLSNKKILDKASKMVSFCEYYSVDNKIIGFGDNDSGRALPLPSYFDYCCTDLNIIKKLSDILKIKYRDIYLKGTTFGIQKIFNENWTVFLRCDEFKDQRKNKVIGGHFHNDQLECLLYYGNIPLFTTYGTYLYIMDNKFRKENLKTEHHNTLSLENYEQNKIVNSWEYIERTARGKVKNKAKDFVECLHEGYEPFVHTRKISIESNNCKIVDTISNFEEKKCTKKLVFILNPETNILSKNENIIVFSIRNRVFKLKSLKKLKITNTDIHHEYGATEYTKQINIILDRENMNVVEICSEMRGE